MFKKGNKVYGILNSPAPLPHYTYPLGYYFPGYLSPTPARDLGPEIPIPHLVNRQSLSCENVWFKLLSSMTTLKLEDEFLDTSKPQFRGVLCCKLRFRGVQKFVGHLRTLSWRCPTLRIKVRRCPETRTRAGNSSSYWAIQNPRKHYLRWRAVKIRNVIPLVLTPDTQIRVSLLSGS